jgi:hypothetical protein
MPHDQALMSISFVCTLSLDSPVTAVILRNISTAILYLSINLSIELGAPGFWWSVQSTPGCPDAAVAQQQLTANPKDIGLIKPY